MRNIANPGLDKLNIQVNNAQVKAAVTGETL
jgi:hypothetical protein